MLVISLFHQFYDHWLYHLTTYTLSWLYDFIKDGQLVIKLPLVCLENKFTNLKTAKNFQ